VGEYLPSSLPQIERVEVVILIGLNPNRVDEYMQGAVKAPAIKVFAEGALRIASLWRQLPRGEPFRCHVPPFGLRFWLANEIVCQASICWECNTIYGIADGRKIAYEFDASHTISQHLLAELQRVTKSCTDAG